MMVFEDENEEKKPSIAMPVEIEPKGDIFDEYNEMLKDIVAA
eukprot:CAMPEP_0170552878 /NCGR_PEP_ID=MMETSP0211-20121228/10771_1 /TAXON_ID=311385 /ORGANISM="Pseudokeronopsis sp., Strain OXSARD2" /LENGTH=41 /DNA_ID= /DNA_START= /DNA_END= /DNA_ORIENTATION=